MFAFTHHTFPGRVGAGVLCAIVSSLGVIGCASDVFRNGTEGALRERITTTSANPLFAQDPLETINLIALIDPDAGKLAFDRDRPIDDAELERAIERFYLLPNREARRNRIVDRMMAASEQRCTVYKNYLKRVETYQGFITGVFTTVLGAAGGMSTVASSSRVLSGLAGISSGIGAELKSDFFADTAALVIVPGIEQRREVIEHTVRGRFGSSISTYTLEAALQDGLRYHGACSLLAGLQQAGVAMREVRNPGLGAVNETLRQLSVTRRLFEKPYAALDPSDVVNQPLAMSISPVARLSGGDVLGTYALETPIDKLLAARAEALALLDRLADRARDVLQILETDKKAGVANLDAPINAVKAFVANSPGMVANRKEVVATISRVGDAYLKATDEIDALTRELLRAAPEEQSEKRLALLKRESEFEAASYINLRLKVGALHSAVSKAMSAIDLRDAAKINAAAGPVTGAAKLI